MKIEKLKENIHPSPNSIVQLKKMGNISEIRFSVNETGGSIKKIDKDNYICLNSGEIKQFNHTNCRADNKSSVAQSLKQLRDIINTNVTDTSKCSWVTLTYRENMQDEKKLYNDFRKFISRINYFLKKNNHAEAEYIVAMEPQGRGARHAHVIFIFNEKAPFIPNNTLSEIWGHGFVSIKSLANVDNIGLYLTAYLGDMELTEAIKNNKNTVIKEIESYDLNGNKSKKHYMKGARLSMYPVGFRIFRKSKGIKKPEIIHCANAEAMNLIGSAKLIYEKTIKLSSNDGVLNVINYRQFNSKISNIKNT